ncbi:MAG: hypothetical protein HYR56_08285 [Acidobacteria bacterium]|nr:hypothetical protein [Acidobacteriota bacterium]MBI3428383.1 hypothetical protein [Acidobacteriota bacterium]
MKFQRFFRNSLSTALRLLVVALLAGALRQATQAQTQPSAQPSAQPRYALVEYMKIEPGKAAEYRKMEQEVWMPVHRERIKAKLIRGWELFGVRYPGGTAREYDVVAVTLYDNFKDLENSAPPEVFTKANPNMKREEFSARAALTRKIVRTEVIALVESAWPGAEDPRSSAAPARYVRVDYKRIEPGKNADYVANERKFYKPLWQAAVDAGTMRGWAVWGARYPSGTEREYGFTTVQFFDKFEQLEGNPSRGLWEKVHPNVKAADITGQMGAISKTVRSELLVLQEHLQ